MAKAGIHPNYQLATITCACGAVYESASTRGSFSVEICASCHPFYTGKQKLLDAAGRIDRFNKRYQLKPGAASVKAEAPKAEKKPEAPKAEKKPEAPKAEKKSEAPKVEKKPEAPKADKKPEAPKADKKPKA